LRWLLRRPQSEVLNFYEVRAFQAHAWVEVYFGSLGWVEFDPTRIPSPQRGVRAVSGPDKDRMAQLIAEIVKNQTGNEELREGAPSRLHGLPPGPGDRQGFAGVVARLWYVVLPGLYLLFLLCTKFLPLLPGFPPGTHAGGRGPTTRAAS